MADDSAKIVSDKTGLKVRVRSFFKRDYFRNKIIIWLIISSLVVNMADWIVLKIFVKPVDLPIILHYNVYFGVDAVGDWRRIFLIPLIGLILFVINVFLSVHFYKRKERIASYLLLMAALMVQLSLVIASVSVIIINY